VLAQHTDMICGPPADYTYHTNFIFPWMRPITA